MDTCGGMGVGDRGGGTTSSNPRPGRDDDSSSKILREARAGQQIVQKNLRETLSAHGMGSGARRDATRQAAHALASESCPSPGSLASRSQDQAGGHARAAPDRKWG